MARVREFTTGWSGEHEDTDHHWQQRDDDELLGALRKSSRVVPGFRPFDMLEGPNQPLPVFANDDMLVGFEAVVGTQPDFSRHVDFDTLWFQFAGQTTVESEQGTVTVDPGELLLMPAGVAHRSSGTADSLRLYAELRDPVQLNLGEDKYQSHTTFKVKRVGGPTWTPAPYTPPSDGMVLERMRLFGQAAEEADVFARRYESLIGISAEGKQLARVRAFDFFWNITGKAGPGPKLFVSNSFFAETYNLEGPQFGFHRALRSEELALQFRGLGITQDELGVKPTPTGTIGYVPAGISHRIVGVEEFLRLVVYSNKPWKLLVDPTKHVCESTFEVETTEVQTAAWRTAAAQPAPAPTPALAGV